MKHGIEDLKCYSDMVSKALSADPIVLSTDPGDGRHYPLYICPEVDMPIESIKAPIVKTIKLPHLLATVYVVDAWRSGRLLAVLVAKWDWPSLGGPR
jgi:hypothetical protein